MLNRLGIAGVLLFLLAPDVFAHDVLRQRIEALNAGYEVEAAGEPLMAKTALKLFYSQRNYALAWTNQAHRDAFNVALTIARRNGLSPDDYHARALAALEARPISTLTPMQIVDQDLLLSDGYLLLASHLLEGKVNPETIDSEWLANRRQRAIEPILAQALATSEIVEMLAALQPQQNGYRRLLKAREAMGHLVDQPWPAIAGGPALKPGTTDPRVAAVRQRLELLGEGLDGGENPAQEAAYYDEKLAGVVATFQRRHGLDADAVVGSGTLAALNTSPAMRLAQIDVNLERWRWLPDDLGSSHMLVNIAGFELELIRNGDLSQRYRVIVGRPFRRTPVFSDKVRYLVFNPTWTVPKTLLVEDKIPEIIRDPSYLRRLGFTVYQGWGADRKEVNPESIDWKTVSRKRFPYQLVQDPGPQNALGQVKFMFPNKFDVYLHDTPSRDLFQKTERSFSSGCVRVEHPLALAAELLGHMPEWSPERIDRVIHERSLTTVYLKTPMPVHIQYWTAWVDREGQLQFRNDLYERDLRVRHALQSRNPGGSSGQRVMNKEG